jgi:hypothetical protein
MKWLDPKKINSNDFDAEIDIIAFIDLKYQKDFTKLEEAGMDPMWNFVTVGSCDYTCSNSGRFIDRLRVDWNGDLLEYELRTVIAWMPLPKMPKIQ